MAVYTPRRLAQAQLTTTSETTLYTVPGGRLAIVKQILLSNTTASTVVADVSIVPAAGSGGVTNRVASQVGVPPNSILVVDLSQVMVAADFISAKAGTANALTLTISGVETAASELPLSGLEFADAGVTVATRPRVNFLAGPLTTVVAVDNPTLSEVDITVTALPQAYVFTQVAPANPWVINHNLGFYPQVTVIDSGGSNVEGDVSYPSINQMQIAFSGAFSGTAYLS